MDKKIYTDEELQEFIAKLENDEEELYEFQIRQRTGEITEKERLMAIAVGLANEPTKLSSEEEWEREVGSYNKHSKEEEEYIKYGKEPTIIKEDEDKIYYSNGSYTEKGHIKHKFIEERVKEIGFYKEPIGYIGKGKTKKEYKKNEYHLYKRVTKLKEYLNENLDKKREKITRTQITKFGDWGSSPQKKRQKFKGGSMPKNGDFEGFREGSQSDRVTLPYMADVQDSLTDPIGVEVGESKKNKKNKAVFELPELADFSGIDLLKNLRDGDKSLNIALDCEWMYLPEEYFFDGRKVLSWQFCLIWGDELFEYIFFDVSSSKSQYIVTSKNDKTIIKDNLLDFDDVLQKIFFDLNLKSFSNGYTNKKCRACVGFDRDNKPLYRDFKDHSLLKNYTDKIIPYLYDSSTGGYYLADECIDNLHAKGKINKFDNVSKIQGIPLRDDNNKKGLKDGKEFFWFRPVTDQDDFEYIDITLICHFGRVDVSCLNNFVDRFFKNCIEVQKGLISNRPITFLVKDRNNGKALRNSFVYPVTMKIRDTMTLTPAGSSKLATLGDLLGLKKVEISQFYKSEMGNLLKTDTKLYFKYASRDAVITLLYSALLFGYNGKIPFSFTSLCAKAFYNFVWGVRKSDNLGNFLSDSVNRFDRRVKFDRYFRGLEKKKIGTIEKDGFYTEQNSLEPATPTLKRVITTANECYFGGLNQCYKVGYFSTDDKIIDFKIYNYDEEVKFQSYDYDMKNCYPTAMMMVHDWDTENPIKTKIIDRYLTLDDFKNEKGEIDPTTYLFGSVKFKNPSSVNFPAIPVNDGERLLFMMESDNETYATGPEILRCLLDGGTVYCIDGFILNKRYNNDGEPQNALADFSKKAVSDRMEARKNNNGVKGSIQEELSKLFINALYGKISQGISLKRTYDAYNDIMHDLAQSSITDPVRAAMITSLVRSCLTSVMSAVEKKGYKVWSATTDGFISNIPEDELHALEYDVFKEFFSVARVNIDENKKPEIWEIKHYNTNLLNLTTRGNVSSYITKPNEKGNIKRGVLAKTGVKSPQGVDSDSLEERRFFMCKALERTERSVTYKVSNNTGFKQYVHNGVYKDTGETDKKQSLNFDMKRKPLIKENEDITVKFINSKGLEDSCKIYNFETTPFKNINEAEKYINTSKNKNMGRLMIKKELVSFIKKADGQRDGIRKTTSSDGLQEIKHFITHYQRSSVECEILDNLPNVKFKLQLINIIGNHVNPFDDKEEFKESDWKLTQRTKGGRNSVLIEVEHLKDLKNMFDNSVYTLEIKKVEDKGQEKYLIQGLKIELESKEIAYINYEDTVKNVNLMGLDKIKTVFDKGKINIKIVE